MWKWFGYRKSDVEQTSVKCKVCKISDYKDGNNTNVCVYVYMLMHVYACKPKC